jgi:hypothetical protein
MSYVDYDDYGLKEVRCMNCNTVIASRSYLEVPSRTEEGKMVNVQTMKMHGNFRQIPVNLSDKTWANLKVCQGCENKDLDMEKMGNKIKDAWLKEMKHCHTPQKQVDEHKKKVKKLKVEGRVK